MMISKRAFLYLGLAALLATPAAQAHEASVGDLIVGHPWARATAGAAPTGAAYLTLTNNGKTPERLLSASTPVADRAELHAHLMEGNVMKMRPIDGIDLDPGAPVELKPGSLHVMLIGLKQPLAEGTKFPLTLTFQKAGTVTVSVEVETAATMQSGHHMH